MKIFNDQGGDRFTVMMEHDPSFLDFILPPELEAGEPAEVRGSGRDDVRLMVSYRGDDRVDHSHFRAVGQFLTPGDLLVINTSGTMNAALEVAAEDGLLLELHLSTHLPADLWTVELRLPTPTGTVPFFDLVAGMTLRLPGGGEAILHLPYLHGREHTSERPNRLWIASLRLPLPLEEYLLRFGFPIRYGHVHKEWPLSYYQTVYATETGSAEMPSAGRAFTPELMTSLAARGVCFAPLLLHTGVASLEDHEPPFEEWYRVPLETARRVNEAHRAGKQVVAVGTTVIRALETVTDEEGTTHPGAGWTDLVITPERRIRAATALLTGLHEPRASHLSMLQAFYEDGTMNRAGHFQRLLPPAESTGRQRLQIAYEEALHHGYLWHEFGDLHLILPEHRL